MKGALTSYKYICSQADTQCYTSGLPLINKKNLEV
jgi:hypothetical protein